MPVEANPELAVPSMMNLPAEINVEPVVQVKVVDVLVFIVQSLSM